MLGTGWKFVWLWIVAIFLVVITMGMFMSAVVDRMIFDKNLRRSTSFVESLRPNRPEWVGAEEWNESVNVTVTALYNVCTYDPKNDKSKKIIGKILSLEKSPPGDPLGKLSKIWEILYYKCNPRERTYLDKLHKYVKSARTHDLDDP